MALRRYFNRNYADFEECLNSEIYVDKSLIIQNLNKIVNTENKFICTSRPRRFGKSMTLKMLNAYYSCGCDSKELFQSLKISKSETFEKYLNKFNVIYLDLNQFISLSGTVKSMIDDIQSEVIIELKRYCSNDMYINWSDLPKALQSIYYETEKKFVVLIDEWDCVFRFFKDNTTAHKEYLDFLRYMFKGRDYVSLVYMTGILPIKKYGVHSALNMFTEISMLDTREYAEFTGFTEQEVKELCNQYNMNFEDTKRWYNGYNLEGVSIYNPRSVVMSMTGRKYNNYWTQTETYEALKVYITMNFEGLRDVITQLIAGGSYKIDTSTFSNDMSTFHNLDDVLTLLVHLGYLSYNFDTQEVKIPNYEISKEFVSVIKISKWDKTIKAIQQSIELLEDTWQLKADKVATTIEEVHQENTSILTYNNENSLSCVITLAYYSAKEYYNIFRELPSGKGFADIVMIPNHRHLDRPAIVIELKYNQNVDTAIDQILNKQYTDTLKDYTGNILLVGINYDKDTKQHTCKIIKDTK